MPNDDPSLAADKGEKETDYGGDDERPRVRDRQDELIPPWFVVVPPRSLVDVVAGHAGC